MPFCEFYKRFKNIFYFDRTPPDDCFLCLSVNFEKFLEHFFYKAPLGNCFFPVQVDAEFQPLLDTVKNYFTDAFQAFYTRTRISHLKAFIYLKSLKTICEEINLQWSCEMPTCKFTEKRFSHILFRVFCLHFLIMHHDYFFRRGFQSRVFVFPGPRPRP